MSKVVYLVVNFGGPRSLLEVEPFLRALLTDKDVIRTRFPQPLHNFLFGRIAKKRAQVVVNDYNKIGGGSPIWSDTEFIAKELEKKLQAPVLTFHRYLPSTHQDFIQQIKQLSCSEIRVFPMFPQFTYATTGSVARFFSRCFDMNLLQKFRWVKSYPAHPGFIAVTQQMIREFLSENDLQDEETCLLFSAHGLPKIFVEQGDLYQYECQLSFDKVMENFPKIKGILCYQSKFGPGEWLRPYTQEVSEQIEKYVDGRQNVVFVPISFTSDHIETLFEVEEQYMPLIEEKGLRSFRVPALNRRSDWIHTIEKILNDLTPTSTHMLIR